MGTVQGNGALHGPGRDIVLAELTERVKDKVMMLWKDGVGDGGWGQHKVIEFCTGLAGTSRWRS